MLDSGADAARGQSPAVADDEISAEAAADLHRDALRLKRSEVAWEAGVLVVVLAAAALAIHVREFGFLVFLAAASVVSMARVTVELVRLRRLGPTES